MIKCAIIEDDSSQADKLRSFIEKYGAENGEKFEIKIYANAVAFLENYTADYDVAFIDIRMPYINGIQASKMLRKKDESILIVFVTSLAQYAIEGYSVNATDYVLKPVEYSDFNMTMTRVMRKIDRNDDTFLLPLKGVNIRLKISAVLYVETSGHNLIYHTEDGMEYTRYAPLKTAVKEFEGKGFSLCNRCYLVNLAHVKTVAGFTVVVGDEELQISQPRKKQFLLDLKEFTGG